MLKAHANFSFDVLKIASLMRISKISDSDLSNRERSGILLKTWHEDLQALVDENAPQMLKELSFNSCN